MISKEIIEIMESRDLPTWENLMKLKQAEEELENVKIEDMTKEDIYFKYVYRGNYARCNNPKVTKALIKYGYIYGALSYIDFLIDKQVIIDLFASEHLKDKEFTVIQGAITNTTIQEEDFGEYNGIKNIMYYLLIEFTSKDKSKVYKFPYLYGNLENVIEFQDEIKPYKNNIIAIRVENKKANTFLLTLVKVYDDIDYHIN